MATTTTPTPHLPNAPCVTITPGISIQPPLSRRGTGPGLIVVVPSDVDLGSHEKTLDPPPRQKWAEESYAVAQIVSDKEGVDIAEKVAVAIGELGRLRGCDDVRRIGLMGRFFFSSLGGSGCKTRWLTVCSCWRGSSCGIA